MLPNTTFLLCWRRDNPFARAAAQGQVEQNAPILQAVAYDLDTLQVWARTLRVG